uniref:BRCA1-associated ATM activator 1 n=3 Tax=Clastoptera arizonana TaxID=38151 RepID=A0A1B6E8Z3_9HEMI
MDIIEINEVINANKNYENQMLFNYSKLGFALSRLLEESLYISDNAIIDKLFSHLVKVTKSKDNLKTNLSLFATWISLALEKYDKIQQSIQIFVLKMAGLVSSLPAGFLMIEKNLVLDKLLNEIMKPSHINSFLILAKVNFLAESIKHQVGLLWVLHSGIWRKVIENSNSSPEIRKASSKFIANLLLIDDSNIDTFANIVDTVLNPFCMTKEMVSISREEALSSAMNIESKNISENQRSTLVLVERITFLNAILKELLERRLCTDKMDLIFKNYNLFDWAWKQVTCEKVDIEIIKASSLLMIYLNLLYSKCSIDGEMSHTDVETFHQTVFQLMKFTLLKKQFLLVFEISSYTLNSTNMFLANEGGTITKENKLFPSHLISIQSLPLIVFTLRNTVQTMDELNLFLDSILATSTDVLKELCEKFINELSKISNKELECLAVKSLINIKRYLDYNIYNESINILKLMILILNQFANKKHFMNDNEPTYLPHSMANLLLNSLFECTIASIKNSKIAFCTLTNVSPLLKMCRTLLNGCTMKEFVNICNMLRHVMEMYTPCAPDSDLITEEKELFEALINSLFKLTKDYQEWEFQDSFLEVIICLARRLINTKNTTIFKDLLDGQDIIDDILTWGLSYPNKYVQGSAWKFFQVSVQNESFCFKHIQSRSVLTLVLDYFVDLEYCLSKISAIQFVMEVIRCYKLCQITEDKLYTVMYHVTLNDFDWEVKKTAFDFWEVVIDNHLAGLSVSPSNLSHILDVRTVLDNLGHTGCLQVLVKSLDEEYDVQVIEAAVRLIHKLMDILNVFLPSGHSMHNTFTSESSLVYESNDNVTDIKTSPEVNSVQKSLYIEKGSGSKIIIKRTNSQLNVKREVYIGRKEFFDKMKEVDIDKTLNSKLQWMDGCLDCLESVLDDVLSVNNNYPDHINNIGLDCY